jgi:MFS family permease
MKIKASERPFFRRHTILLVYICTFLYWMAMYLYVQILPVYTESLGGSLVVVGLVVAAYAVPQFLLRIPIGIWSDAIGRQKPIMVLGILAVLLGSIGLVLSPGPLFLGLSRLLVGVGAAVWVVFPVYLVSYFTSDKLGSVMGTLNFTTGASLVAASLIGGILADFRGEKFVFISSAALAAVALLAVLLTRENRINRIGVSWQRLGQVVRRPLLIVASVMGILLFFAEFASVWGFVPVYASRLGATGTLLGILTMMVTGGTMLGSLVAAPLVKRAGQVLSIIISSLMLGLVLLSIPFIHNLVVLGTVLFIHGVGFGILSTQLMVLSIHNISPQQRATAMGFYQAVYALGMLTGPLLSGYLSGNWGLSVVFYLGGALCLAIAGMAFFPVIPGRPRPIKDV